MSTKITAEHLAREAVVYVRQSSMGQVLENTESQHRQYALADTARTMGFGRVQVIDDDLGRSGSGQVHRPGFERLVASVCTGSVGAVFCLEASRLARNGRDWHHLIDLCALVGTVVVDPDGVYEPRLINDRLLLGLKGTMSEYELSLLRQRGLAARESKAKRGELQFGLPPGLCWDDLGRIVIDPDERVSEAVRMIFRKFNELGSVRQVLLWAVDAGIQVPVFYTRARKSAVRWRIPGYHNILQVVQNPMYAGAYAFGRTETRTVVVDGRARKSPGCRRGRERWLVLLQDHHPGYITWQEFEQNQAMLAENAHMKKATERKSGKGGRALLSGMVRCGRCGHMMRIFYSSKAGHAHRYICVGDQMRGKTGLCIGVGGVGVDRAVAEQMLAAVKPQAVEAAALAAERLKAMDVEAIGAVQRELEDAQYEARLASRRYEAVDPEKRLVARELEARWEAALRRVSELETRLKSLRDKTTGQPDVDRAALARLAADLTEVWNSPTTSMATRQRLARVLIREVIADHDEQANESHVLIHWIGGRHTELRLARRRGPEIPDKARPVAAEAMRKLGGRWPDRELAVTLNRMRCKSDDGSSWTVAKVRALRAQLGIAEFQPASRLRETLTVDQTAVTLGICVGSVMRLIRERVLPAEQILPGAPWEIPVDALQTEAVRIGVQSIIDRRPRNFSELQELKCSRLPGL
jgi:DNA invertase Pin-like site-specific DNA recombinase